MDGIVKEGSSEEVIFEQRSEGSEWASLADVKRKMFPEKERISAKCPGWERARC